MLGPGHRLSAVALSFIAAAAAAQPGADPADRYPVRYADVAGTKLAYVEAGRGGPVLLVHGALSDYRYWEPQLAGGPDGVRVIAYSRRDFYPNASDSVSCAEPSQRHVAGRSTSGGRRQQESSSLSASPFSDSLLVA